MRIDYEASGTQEPQRKLPTIPGEIHTLIVGTVELRYEPIVERLLGCLGHSVWFHCEGGWIWDPYDSMARSVLMAIRRNLSIRNIYVITETEWALGPSLSSMPVQLGTGVPSPAVRTVRYLLQQIYAVNPTRWMGSASKPDETVACTVRLLRDHPLMHPAVNIQGLLLNGPASELAPVEA